MNEITNDLKKCKTLTDFLHYVRGTDGLRLVSDNGYSWLEYNGEEVEGSAKERFTSQSEMDVLLQMAGLS